MNDAKKYYLKYDCPSVVYGQQVNYYHFLLGYLLPLLNEIINIESDTRLKGINKTYFFTTCGPIMNKVIDEMLSYYNLNYALVDDPFRSIECDFDEIRVPRWDLYIENFIPLTTKLQNIYTGTSKEELLRLSLYKGKLKKFFNFFCAFNKTSKKRSCLESLLKVKADIMQRIDNTLQLPETNSMGGYLILKRSPRPKNYNGRAYYGVESRQLIGIEKAVDHLSVNGFSVSIFEPGKHSLVEQIKTFQGCKGIIGVRGAEFANMVWMNKNSKVILINSPNMNLAPLAPQKALAEILSLDYCEIQTTETRCHELNPALIAKILGKNR